MRTNWSRWPDERSAVPSRLWFRPSLLGAAMLILFLTALGAQAGPLFVAGSLTYDPATEIGFESTQSPTVNNHGVAVGRAVKLVGRPDIYAGDRPVRWDASGTAVELGILGTDTWGKAYPGIAAINDAGTAVGYCEKYEDGEAVAGVAVRWDAGSTAPTELGDLGRGARAKAINAVGTIVGVADKGSGDHRPVRWDAASTAATELGVLGTDSRGRAQASAVAVNNAGTAVGQSTRYAEGVFHGWGAVRWDAGGTDATELQPLATDGDGFAYAGAVAVNSAGTAVGFSGILNPAHIPHTDERAVRWDAGSTVATPLDGLGADSLGHVHTAVAAINDAGTAVGWALKPNDVPKGYYAVRWDAGGTAVNELEYLDVNENGSVMAKAYAINSSGTIAGYAQKSIDDHDHDRAVIWRPDGGIIDLNDLGLVPVGDAGFWELGDATAISDDGWVAGCGWFLAEGGPVGYSRHWVAQVGLGGNWTNVAGGIWGRGPNWSSGTPAMQVGNATFGIEATYTVALDRDETTQSVAVDAGDVAIQLDGHVFAAETSATVAQGASLTLAGAGALLLDVNSGSESNSILGDGQIHLDATLRFDVTDVSTYGSWNVLAVDTLTEEFGGGFRVEFAVGSDALAATEISPGVWAADVPSLGAAIFREASGILSVVPEPGTLYASAAGLLSLIACAWRQRRPNQDGERRPH